MQYNNNRAYTNISSKSKATIDDYLRRTANFIQLASKSNDWIYVEFKIPSFALRKKLGFELSKLYKDKTLIFYQFTKDSDVFTVKKSKNKDSKDNQDKKEVKIATSETDESVYEKLAKGQKINDLKILHEDDKCVVFEEPQPVAAKHFIVLAKSSLLESMNNSEDKDAKVLGELMLIVSAQAKAQGLSEGYRVIVDTEPHSKTLAIHVIGGQ